MIQKQQDTTENASGRWHQKRSDPESFKGASADGQSVNSLGVGSELGWLERAGGEFFESLDRLSDGCFRARKFDEHIGICGGDDGP